MVMTGCRATAPDPPGDAAAIGTAGCAGTFKEALVQRGFQEAITYSFVDPAFQAVLDPARQPLALTNPISADLAAMRTSLWPGLLKALIHNQKRQQPRVRLFEHGLTFVPANDGLRQEPYLGGVLAGTALPEQWGLPKRAADFSISKSDVEALLALTGEPEAFAFVAAVHPALHPGQCARIEEGRRTGRLAGHLHPRVARELDVEGDAFVFELALGGLQTARVPIFHELSAFQPVAAISRLWWMRRPRSRRFGTVYASTAAGIIARCGFSMFIGVGNFRWPEKFGFGIDFTGFLAQSYRQCGRGDRIRHHRWTGGTVWRNA